MITLKDIAKEAGVTVSTVSRALKGDSEIAQGTRDKITEIAFRLGYRSRRDILNGRHIMGVIIPDMSSSFFTDMLVAIDQQLSEIGYTPLYAPYYFDDESYKNAFELCRKRKVEGILAVCPIDKMSEYVKQFTVMNAIPVVMVMSQLGDAYSFLDGVSVDITNALSEAITVFKADGHERIGLMTDVLNYKLRGLDYEIAFRNNGYKDGQYPIYLTEKRFEEGGYECMLDALKSKDYPTAFIVGYDHFAIGVCRAVREMGLRIPEDIAICGIDNLGLDEFIYPALASVAVPVKEMVRTAVGYMKKSLQEGEEKTTYRTTLNGRLYVRESMRRKE